MYALESIKRLAERIIGRARPAAGGVARMVRDRKPNTFAFKDDGLIPNHPCWPLIFYRSVVPLPDEFDPAAVFEELFAHNGWGDSWRNGIYDYPHYHSRIHEVLGIARGEAKVRF